MSDEKTTGSYYTPHDLIAFMIEYLEKEKQDFSNVLEPSAGDGRFLSLLLKKSLQVDAIELFDEKVRSIRKLYSDPKLDVSKNDFIEYAANSKKKYSLIIGNPPYISSKIMDKDKLEEARQLCEMEHLSRSAMQNMWLAFVIGACRLLRPDGAIFYVLPMEFLQVQYAEKLRNHLESKFNTIHIISFEKTIFTEIEQEICLVYLTNKENESDHIYYKIYDDANCKNPISVSLIQRNKPLQKWSNAILSDDEISLLKEKGELFTEIGTMGEIAPGVVTGGNKYFILTEKKVKECNCKKYVLPIVQKSSFIPNNTIEIDKNVLINIKKDKKPVYLLDLAKAPEKSKLPKELQEYLEWAGKQKVGDTELKKRFKCANRIPWYGVPIVNKGQVVFFKRYDLLPRIYINKIDVHTTDAGYHIRLKEEYDAESFVFCFFNSMTLAECEYNGRYYGGGVSELVPSEFKSLTIPYRRISKKDILELKRKFKREESIKEIVSFVNERTISMDLSAEDVQKFEEIRQKLIRRRIE